jgi:hypothetical protein
VCCEILRYIDNMHPWEREELKKQDARIAEQMMKHYNDCGACASDVTGRGDATCAMMREFLSKKNKIRELLGVLS